VDRRIVISYDGTPNDDDALALGMALASADVRPVLAYVRHSREFDPGREELAQHDACRRLALGAEQLGDPSLPTRVVFDASTPGGLERLAREQGALLIAFGSDYRTAPGRAEPGNSAQHLLDGGAVAVAVAATGLRTRMGEPIQTIAVSSHDADGSARRTAESLAAQLGAAILAANGEPVDLIVVASQPSAPPGRIALGGPTRAELNAARGSVLVLASATPLRFGTDVLAPTPTSTEGALR
jgi:hypothetical protein